MFGVVKREPSKKFGRNKSKFNPYITVLYGDKLIAYHASGKETTDNVHTHPHLELIAFIRSQKGLNIVAISKFTSKVRLHEMQKDIQLLKYENETEKRVFELLKKQNDVLETKSKKAIADLEAKVESLEMENASLRDKVEALTLSHDKLLAIHDDGAMSGRMSNDALEFGHEVAEKSLEGGRQPKWFLLANFWK
ncbi:UNVERIFIED_CONTAM: hypothetical protein HDU68_011829 [Siphonaria sp. JEL0065]|nr:hypothetical protein HDU68_011829 [Siphonaria sp. JEL0065]